jgi:hypothetical protein
MEPKRSAVFKTTSENEGLVYINFKNLFFADAFAILFSTALVKTSDTSANNWIID